MKKRIALSVAVSLFLIFGLAAAGEENGAEQIVVLQEFAVHPEGMVGFEAVLMALQGPAAEHGIDAEAELEKLETAVGEAKEAKDSLGGIVACICRNVPVGLGEPVFDKLEAALAGQLEIEPDEQVEQHPFRLRSPVALDDVEIPRVEDRAVLLAADLHRLLGGDQREIVAARNVVKVRPLKNLKSMV